MRIKVFTLFPEMLRPVLSQSILGRAIAAGQIEVELIDIRAYTLDKHRRTDDYPFGGGAGMVMSAQPIVDAFADRCAPPWHGRRIYLSPRGRTLDQRIVEELAREDELALLCGHYEGVDQRALDAVIDEELSIGDYVLTGGELGALVVIDAVSRLIPGVLGSDESSADESFTTGLLEYPQYTRPADFRGHRVPRVLLDGNHADITAWRREMSLETTLRHRPELLKAAPLTDEDRALIDRLEASGQTEAFLNDLGARWKRLPLREGESWARRWLISFVPEAARKEARKRCLDGRRHAGSLWRAFDEGFAPCIRDGAQALWRERVKAAFTLYLPRHKLLYEIEAAPNASPDDFAPLGDYALADTALTFTLVRAKAQYGFAEAAS